jgi:hypothetical protein
MIILQVPTPAQPHHRQNSLTVRFPGTHTAPITNTWAWYQTEGVNSGANGAKKAVISAGKLNIPILVRKNAHHLILPLVV